MAIKNMVFGSVTIGGVDFKVGIPQKYVRKDGTWQSEGYMLNTQGTEVGVVLTTKNGQFCSVCRQYNKAHVVWADRHTSYPCMRGCAAIGVANDGKSVLTIC